MKFENLRPGQQSALDTIIDRVRSREQKTAIVLPTRYGKSDVIRLASVLLVDEGVSSGSIALSPSMVLRNQLVRADKVADMVARYCLPESAKAMRAMQSAYELRPFSNGEYMLSATIQLATLNMELMCELVKHQYHACDELPVVIHIDECHETSDQKRRGEMVERLCDAGALVVLYTATAIRADGELIPGFSMNVISSEDVKRYVTTDAGDGIRNRVDVYAGESRLVELVADHTTTFQEAWSEFPSPICKLSRELIEVNLNDVSASEDNILLSQCCESKARKYLSKAVRNPGVIERAVSAFVGELKAWQNANPSAAGIIFSCSDKGGEKNKHGKEIERAINDIAPELQTCIVTMKSDEGDEKSTKQLERFVGVDGRNGSGDVLIVKQMGGAGLDAPRIKVLLDLSPVRTVASVIQRVMRVATPWEGHCTARVITLADPVMDAIWRRYVVEEGGETKMLSNIDCEMDLIDSYLKEKEESPDLPLMEVTSAYVCGFDDNSGTTGDIAHLEFINELCRRLPILQTQFTKASLSRSLDGLSIGSTGTREPERPLDATIRKKQADIYERVKALAQQESPYNPKSPEAHRERLQYWFSRAKSAAGVPSGTELKNVVNVSALDVMLNFLAR